MAQEDAFVEEKIEVEQEALILAEEKFRLEAAKSLEAAEKKISKAVTDEYRSYYGVKTSYD